MTHARKPARPTPWFVALTLLGVAAIGYFVWDAVSAIRAESRALEERYEDAERGIQDAMPDGSDGATTPFGAGDEVVVRLAEVQRPGPGVGGRYNLDVGDLRWALDAPATDADEAARAAWAEQATPRWAALRTSLEALTASGAEVKAEIFAPWKDEPEAAPTEFLTRLITNLAGAGVVDVDIENAPPELLDDD